MKKILFLILFFSISLYSQDHNLKLIKDKIEENYYTFDYKKLDNILEECQKIKNISWQKKYFLGMLHLLMGKIIYNDNNDKAFDHFDKSVSNFEKAYEINKNAEIAALLSAAYGKKSSLAGFNAIMLGIKAKNSIYEAHELDDSNPKVYLVAATHLMHLPAIYGGDKDQAETMLYKALELNKNRKNDDWLISWAKNPEIYAYQAQLEILRGNKQKANNLMDKALVLIPDYGFILYDLKKQLK